MSTLLHEEQIQHMVQRFLAWKLPIDNFHPDCGISAQRPNYGPNVKWEPTGTNLLDYTQADAMVRHMLEGLPTNTDEGWRPSKEQMLAESGHEVGAGVDR